MTNHEPAYVYMCQTLSFYKPREEVKQAIWKAYNDPDWDWRKSNGCNIISEQHAPDGIKFPPCVMHDHLCETTDDRFYANRLLFYAKIDYKTKKWIAVGAWGVCNAYWVLWGKWKHMLRRSARRKK